MSENWYERHVLPYLIDLACCTRPTRKQRLKVVPLAQGRVLEVGIGNGLHMPFYDKAGVRSIVGVDPAQSMGRLALRRIRDSGLSVELIGLSAEMLVAADANFETVVSTYALCTIPDLSSALRETRRVLAPGGKLLFSEHGLAPDLEVRVWQGRLLHWWGRSSGGCRLNGDIPTLLAEAGFRPDVQQRDIPGPRFVSYHCWGEAVAA